MTSNVNSRILIYFFSFEQEENEMKMMSCIFDEGEDDSISASSSSNVSSNETPLEPKMNLKQRFMKKKSSEQSSSKVHRSASAIIRAKMYKVVTPKKKRMEKGTLDKITRL
jgi:hypothetical protein